MSACESRTSPARASTNTGSTFAPVMRVISSKGSSSEIRPPVAAVACAGSAEPRIPLRAGDALPLFDELQQRDPPACRDVDYFPARVWRLARAQDAVDDVVDVGEVAGLPAVAADGRAAPF